MRGLPKRAVKAAEELAVALLKDALKEHGARIPVSNPDYAEAFGVLRGVLAYSGDATAFQPVRIAPGHGPATYESVSRWLGSLRDRAMREIHMDLDETDRATT